MAVAGLDAIKEFVPDISFGGVFGAVTLLLLLAVAAAVIIGVGVFIIRRRQYKYTINVFEKISGRWEHSRKYKARELKVGRGGAMVLLLKKLKKPLPMPKLQMGRKIFWYAIREDGEWINFDIEDIDLLMKRAGIHFIDEEMRHTNTALEESLKERYDKPNFWKEYGVMIASIGFIVILAVMMWLLFDKWIELAATTNDGVKTAGEVIKLAQETLVSIDNIKVTNCPVT